MLAVALSADGAAPDVAVGAAMLLLRLLHMRRQVDHFVVLQVLPLQCLAGLLQADLLQAAAASHTTFNPQQTLNMRPR